MDELLFTVTQDQDGGFSAAAVGEGIFTQGDTWEELGQMAIDATRAYFHDRARPKYIRLRLDHEEILIPSQTEPQ